jgi:hypothetical protein
MNYKRLNRILFSSFLLCTAHSYGQTTVVWGDYDTRTERRNDAGLQGSAGSKSGFYETPTPVNFPSGASSWWHLLDIRHSNPGNNFAMQFAGSFYDQDLFFRKTNDNPSQSWTKVALEDHLHVSLGTIAQNYTPNTGNWTTSGTTLRLNGQDYTSIGFHDSGNRVDFIRAGNGVIQLGYNGGWGEANLGMPGGGQWSNSGNVGIGTADTKGYKLAVAGNAIAESITVKLQGQWGDYVFKPTYKLRPLSDVKNFIDQNQHLPEIPSAKEIEKSGIDLGEMVKLQTKKIEELTLYLIESNKQLLQQQAISKKQAQALSELRQSVNSLKAQIKK